MHLLPPYLDYVQLIADRRQSGPKPRPPRRPVRIVFRGER
jgi:hypothetical protein